MVYGRWSTELPDGRTVSGFFAANFTLAELKTLYAKQALPGRDQSQSHKYRYDLAASKCIAQTKGQRDAMHLPAANLVLCLPHCC